MSYIAGYLATISVNGDPINQWSSQASLAKTTNAISVGTLGETHQVYANGKKDTVMTATLHLDTSGLVQLQAADDATTPVDCVFRPGAIGVNTDAGQYNGVGIITDMTIAGGSDSEWDVDLTVQGSQEWPYTAPI
jgi:predicted secreted protein